ncbi:hypothetical protein D9757_011471 [Collybiopsis confluens]|uniref:SAP domain-containing protein n=1 Tax=Collybiopsis confluens TaxID=2823264 RepID=A0A8H5GJQ3_9AGAR|nr:hypothetical protein D9757_011471 [Collybiopsis confluens]
MGRTIAFEEGDNRVALPDDSGGSKEVNLTELKAPELLALCRKYGLSTGKRTSSECLSAIRTFSANPDGWSKPKKIAKNKPRSKLGSRTKSKESQSDPRYFKASTEKRNVDLDKWLEFVERAGESSADSASLIRDIQASSKNMDTALVELIKTKVASIASSSVFLATHSVPLTAGKVLVFNVTDIAVYPRVLMPQQPLSYLQEILRLWDDCITAWQAESCPLIRGTPVPAKYWKDIYSKGGHWKSSAVRTLWNKWKVCFLLDSILGESDDPKVLFDAMRPFDFNPENFYESHKNSSGSHLPTICNIMSALQEQRSQQNAAVIWKFDSEYGCDPGLLRDVLAYEKKGSHYCTTDSAVARRFRRRISMLG